MKTIRKNIVNLKGWLKTPLPDIDYVRLLKYYRMELLKMNLKRLRKVKK